MVSLSPLIYLLLVLHSFQTLAATPAFLACSAQPAEEAARLCVPPLLSHVALDRGILYPGGNGRLESLALSWEREAARGKCTVVALCSSQLVREATHGVATWPSLLASSLELRSVTVLVSEQDPLCGTTHMPATAQLIVWEVSKRRPVSNSSV